MGIGSLSMERQNNGEYIQARKRYFGIKLKLQDARSQAIILPISFITVQWLSRTDKGQVADGCYEPIMRSYLHICKCKDASKAWGNLLMPYFPEKQWSMTTSVSYFNFPVAGFELQILLRPSIRCKKKKKNLQAVVLFLAYTYIYHWPCVL